MHGRGRMAATDFARMKLKDPLDPGSVEQRV